jgi:putative oxidoreductase
MKIVNNIVGGLLGLLFIFSASVVLFKINIPQPPPPPEGSAPAHFMAAFMPTGYMHFVKVFELLGGILVAIPKTRNFGLLILGPIILNIIAFHGFVAKEGLFSPMLIIICLAALYLLWVGRRQFINLKN